MTNADMRIEMCCAMRDLLGGGYVADYYEQAAQPFIEVAERYHTRATRTTKRKTSSRRNLKKGQPLANDRNAVVVAERSHVSRTISRSRR